MELIHISSRGQIVIPERVRKKYKLKAGSKLVLLEEDRGLLLRRESDVEQELREDRKEIEGWMRLGMEGMRSVWDNPEDDEVWNKYAN